MAQECNLEVLTVPAKSGKTEMPPSWINSHYLIWIPKNSPVGYLALLPNKHTRIEKFALSGAGLEEKSFYQFQVLPWNEPCDDIEVIIPQSNTLCCNNSLAILFKTRSNSENKIAPVNFIPMSKRGAALQSLSQLWNFPKGLLPPTNIPPSTLETVTLNGLILYQGLPHLGLGYEPSYSSHVWNAWEYLDPKEGRFPFWNQQSYEDGLFAPRTPLLVGKAAVTRDLRDKIGQAQEMSNLFLYSSKTIAVLGL